MSKFKLDRAEVHSALHLLVDDVCAHGDYGKFISGVLANHLSSIALEAGTLEAAGASLKPNAKTFPQFTLSVGAELMVMTTLYKNFTLEVDCRATGMPRLAYPFLVISATPDELVTEFHRWRHSIARNEVKHLSDAMNLVEGVIEGFCRGLS